MKKTSIETGLEIAVIGMAGKFPGAKNLEEFWENVKRGVESISFFSNKELVECGISEASIESPNYVKAYGVIAGREYFDASFFGYSPKEAETLDPLIRLLHECSWEALEDAGYDPMSYHGSIGMYAGASDGFGWKAALRLRNLTDQSENVAGHMTDCTLLLSSRLSHKLNLRGPSITMFTACSTGLVTVHTACRALLTGECEMALAGAGSVLSAGKTGYLYQEGMIMSPDGHCRAFDEKAKGTLYGEGAGVVLLKRLKDARADGDTIRCIIKASAVNNDGTGKASFTAPGKKRIADVIRAVLKLSRVAPEDIGYIEAHGTATSLGDAIEIEALKEAFNTGKKGFCGIGSVKSNFGHLDVAAGIAGFIKTVLSLMHRLIPPTLHFESPNPKMDFIGSPFYMNNMLSPWEDEYQGETGCSSFKAGVCSFGVGGTNAFVLVEEAAPELPAATQSKVPQLLLLSARTGSALEKMTGNLVDYLKNNPGINLADVAYTLQVGRRAFNHRRMLVCSDSEEAVEALSFPGDGRVQTSVVKGKARDLTDNPAGEGVETLKKIGMAWLNGANVDWQEFYAKYLKESNRERFRIPLPTYPFERERFWIDVGPLEFFTPDRVVQMEGLNSGVETKPEAVVPVEEKVSAGLYPRPPLSTEYAAPSNEVEHALVGVWQKFFGIGEVGIYDDFFELGGDSLKAITVVLEIHKLLDTRIPITEIFQSPTIRELAEYIKGAESDKYSAIEPVEEREYFPLSSVQKRIYILQQIEMGSTGYNNPLIFEMEGQLDKERLENVFSTLVSRHESLRTYFELIEGETVQRIHREVEFEVEYHSLERRAESKESSFTPYAGFVENFVRSFDLSKAPLLRVGLVRINEENHVLMTDMHHIATDGSSIGILMREFMTLYTGEALLPLRIQYKDYSQWQNSDKQIEAMKKQEAYWLKVFEDEIPVLNLPTDYARPAIQSFEGSTKSFVIDREETGALKKVALNEDATLFMILLSIYNIMLAKICGQEDIVVGTPLAARTHADLQHLIGMLVNTLTLRNYPPREKTFREFLKEVRENTLAAFANQDYLFEDLVEQVTERAKVNRDVSRNPVFDVMFNLLNIQSQYEANLEIKTTGLSLRPCRYEKGISIFDLIFQGSEEQPGLFFTVDFCTRLFKPETIDRFIGYFKKIVSIVVASPGIRISEIQIISAEEKRQILYDFNRIDAADVPGTGHLIHELFEEQVKQKPDYTALVFEENHLTYKELNKKSGQLAGLLRLKGVGPDVVVGVMVERSIEMVLGILAVLKAGGAYLPIDSEYPEQRILSMLMDSGASILLTKGYLLGRFSITAFKNMKAGDEHLVITPPREPIKDFDSIPIPDRTLIDYNKYHRYIGEAPAKNTITLQATRGCPYNCLYCHKIWSKTHVARSAANVFQEISYAYDAGLRRFVFIDDIFNLDQKNAGLLLEKIVKSNLDIQLFFPNGFRADILTKDFIDLMMEAGTVNLDVALESASPRIQRLIRKNLNLEKFKENVHYITGKYPYVILEMEMMHGFPTETIEEAMMTLDFLKQLKWVHFPNLHVLKIFPNTDICKLAEANGISGELIERSANLAYHELPDTLPFPKSFTRQFQAKFMGEYFLLKERLLDVLPHQMRVLTEDELVQKYDSYLSFEIKRFHDILKYTGISRAELKDVELPREEMYRVPDFREKMSKYFPVKEPAEDAFRILLLDLSQLFTEEHEHMLHHQVEEPLGLLYLMSYLNEKFKERISGKVFKSKIDFDSYDELKKIIIGFKPDLLGIRSLSFYKEFFHKAVLMIRQWGVDVPIVAGGPYATSDYKLILQDPYVDVVVLGEGELTLGQLVDRMMENGNKLPDEEVLRQIPGIAFAESEYKTLRKKQTREVILLDEVAGESSNYADENLQPVNPHHALLYVIYTSGSTGIPKGVMLEHQGLSNLILYQYRYTDIDFSRVLQFTTISFDVSFQEIFSTLLAGGTLFLVSSETVGNIPRLFGFIEESQIKTLFLPASFLKFIFNEQEYVSIFPGCIDHIAAAGEQLIITRRTGEYLKANSVYLHNHYGPAETHVVTTLTIDPQSEIPGLPSIGKPLVNTHIYIVDKASHFQPVGIAGELVIGGIQVGRGYLNRPELTNEKFDRDLWDFHDYQDEENYQKFFGGSRGAILQKSPPGRRRLYKTGDLARWLSDGNIEFLGRLDHQVKIRGFRIEPGEIESRLMDMGQVKETVVTARDDTRGEKYLCAYVVPVGAAGDQQENKVDVVALRNKLSNVLPDYMLPSYIVPMDEIPLTPSGKVNRKALPEPRLDEPGERAAPGDIVEMELTRLWAEVLGMEKDSISVDADFFGLGGHSLRAAVLTTKIHKCFNVEVKLGEIFRQPTIRALAGYIEEAEEERYTDIKAVETKDYYPLSSAQKRLHFLQQMDLESTAYNMADVLKLEGGADKDKLEKTFREMTRRHESFRTSFIIVDEEPVQRIHREVDFEIELFSAARGAVCCAGFVKNFVRAFDLSKAPLLRAGLVKLEENKHLVMMDLHHIISDGVSNRMFVREFLRLYFGEILPGLRVQYKDYAVWQNSETLKWITGSQEKYWLREFSDEVPVLHLPYDYLRPAVQGFEGSSFVFEIGKEETAALNRLALEHGVTLFMVLIAGFNILLSKFSGQQDIVLGTPTAGRGHTDLENIMGMFVNTLALRNFPRAGKTFKEFLFEVKTRTLEAFENQEYQFENLVENVAVRRDISRNPLFDVMFALQNLEERIEIAPTGTEQFVSEYRFEKWVSRFDMTWSAMEKGTWLSIEVEYCTRLFKRETIERFAACFRKLLAAVIALPDTRTADIEIITEEEKQRVLFEFNDTEVEYPIDKTLHQLFEEQAEKSCDGVAVIGQGVGAQGTVPVPGDHISITYSELNRKSNQLAHYLRNQGVKGNEPVGLLAERSPGMIVGILGILKAGCAYVPLNPKAPPARTKYMLNECNVRILVSGFSEVSEVSEGCEVVKLDELNEELPTHLTHLTHPTQLSYVIYTSGSTGKPKGVPITHSNVCPLLHWGYRHLGLGVTDRVIQNLSYFFDWSVWEIFITLTSGASLFIIPDEILLNPVACIAFMNENEITALHVTPTQYGCFADTNQKLETLKFLFIGAEKLTHELLKRSFASITPGCRIFNMYGPTETAILSTTLEIHRGDYRRFEGLSSIPIGPPIANTELLVLDSGLNLCPVNVTGELYIGGDGTAAGYLNRPELTAEKFHIFSYKSYRTYRTYFSQRIYKTGDLVRWLPDGNLEFLGRIDHQVKIRGYRIELGEIENHLSMHTGIKEALVMTKEIDGGDKFLCAYIVPEQEDCNEVLTGELKEYLSQTLPAYMIPSYFVLLKKMPLTPNGKVDRKALPDPAAIYKSKYAAPTDEIEEKLAVICTELLGVSIGIDDNFFELGGHSLKIMALISKIHKELDVKIPLIEVFQCQTIRKLSQYIRNTSMPLDRYSAIPKAEEKEYYALSAAQKRLFIIQQMELESTQYNMLFMFPFGNKEEEGIEKERLDKIFRKLINRHESLRTSFHLVNEEPVQMIQDEMEFEIGYYLATEATEGSISNFVRPFDLSRAPLIRLGLIKTHEGSHIWMVDMHHIISDGISQGILEREFAVLYASEELPPQRLQYKDYSEWQNSKQQQKIMKIQGKYWLKKFSGELPILNLPADYPRPLVQGYEGRQLRFFIAKEITTSLKELCGKTGATLYMLLLSALNVLLSRLSGQEDIIVGTPIVGRRHADLQDIIGMFVNTLSMRNFPAEEKRFSDFLIEVKECTLEVYENQEYQFEDLVDKVSVKRDTSRNPIFDVMLDYLDRSEFRVDIKGVDLDTDTISDMGESKVNFDITFEGKEVDDVLYFTVDYCAKIYHVETIKRFIIYFKRILAEIKDDPGRRLSSINLISEEEKKQVLVDFNDTLVEYRCDKMIHELFAEQAEKRPDGVAVVGAQGTVPIPTDHVSITYKELNEKSNHLAHVLRKKGVGPDIIVGIMVDRSVEMIKGILGILKSGGAYLPIAPDYPQERIDYMLKDSNAAFLLTAGETPDVFKGTACCAPTISPVTCSLHLSLAYVIYTSGSTGRPKGVMVEHRNLLAYVEAFSREFKITPEDTVMQQASFTFDAFVEEVYPTLLNGGRIAIAVSDELLDINLLSKFIARNRINVISFSPLLLNQLNQCSDLDRVCRYIHTVISGGDVLKQEYISELLKIGSVYNTYGPTETTVCVTYYKCLNEVGSLIPIGKPIANYKVYILDKHNNLLPIGVAGELCVAGDGAARGYLNQPGLTAEKFVFASYRSYRSYRTYISKKIYRTGDLARWRGDGNIEFIGRMDQQVKVRGYRIEPGEIENQLLKIKGIKEAVVLVREDNTFQNSLYAYIVSEPGMKMNPREIKNTLAMVFPAYMIPDYLMPVDKIPLTSHGKIDRMALAAPGARVTDTITAPRNDIEEKVIEIWAEILGMEKEAIGITDNFFELGGHSLKMTKLIIKIHKVFNVGIPVGELFKKPTVEGVCSLISVAVWAQEQDQRKNVGVKDEEVIL